VPVALVVVDMPAARAMACEVLHAFGFECFDAWNGGTRSGSSSSHPEIDVLCTDVRMPGMTGTDLAAEARRMRPDLTVVLTSGYVDGAPVDGLPFLRSPMA